MHLQAARNLSAHLLFKAGCMHVTFELQILNVTDLLHGVACLMERNLHGDLKTA